jgi:hypothetical protein
VRRRRYPLDPLRSLRDANVRAHTLELGRSIQGREQAEESHAAAEAARREREEAVREEQRSEGARLESGALRTADLEAQAQWAHGEGQRLAALCERERRATEQLLNERRNEERAQEALALAEQAARVVQKHQGAWQKAERTRAETAEEDEALDIHVARAESTRARGGS